MRGRFQKVSIAGSIDEWTPALIGWAYDRDNPGEPVELAVLVDDLEVARFFASESRADVVRSGHAVLNCGFSLEIFPLLNDSSVIRVVDVKCETELFRSPSNLKRRILSPRARSDGVGLESVLAEIGDESVLDAAIAQNKSMAFVSSYRAEESSDAAIRQLTKSFADQGIAMVLIDTSPQQPRDTLGAEMVLWRENIGWDFASWFAGFDRFNAKIGQLDRLYFVNDSCLGPFGGLSQVIDRGWSLDLDVWSLTDSWDTGYHLQSYFLAFSGSAIQQGVIEGFKSNFDFPVVKRDVIHRGEVALTRYLRSEGLRVGSIFPYHELADHFLGGFALQVTERLQRPEVASIRAVNPSYLPPDVISLINRSEWISSGHPINPTHSFWRELVEQGFPFMKRELLVKDPTAVNEMSQIGQWMKEHLSAQELEVVVRDLGSRDMSRAFLIG
ncbi:MAG: hypothetical protein NT081_05085 [Actinobacteria bacterium]|nr:hypothetical protein [Actinomycetota bacterium]